MKGRSRFAGADKIAENSVGYQRETPRDMCACGRGCIRGDATADKSPCPSALVDSVVRVGRARDGNDRPAPALIGRITDVFRLRIGGTVLLITKWTYGKS